MNYRTIVALGVLLGAVGVCRAEPVVSLLKLVETREHVVEKSTFDGWNTGVKLSLRATGDEIKGARQYGKLKIDKAVDDTGADLTAVAGDRPMRSASQMDPVQTPFGNDKPKEGVEFDLELPTTPARNAKSISLKGSITFIVGGEKKIVKVPKVKSRLGETIDSPELKSLGLTFALVKGKTGPMAMAINGVSAEITGDPSLLATVNIVDAEGEKLSSGAMWSDAGGKRSITYMLEKPLSDDAELQIEVWPGQKIVVAPIEFKDLKLP